MCIESALMIIPTSNLLLLYAGSHTGTSIKYTRSPLREKRSQPEACAVYQHIFVYMKQGGGLKILRPDRKYFVTLTAWILG